MQHGDLNRWQPRGRLWGLLCWWLQRRGVYLGVPYTREEWNRQIEEHDLDVSDLLVEIREQLYQARRTNAKLTKIVVGPATYVKLTKDVHQRPDEWGIYSFPSQVPLICGLELVVNPCIEGVAVC